MQQLETIKGKSIIIPKLVNRYLLTYYDLSQGWLIESNFYTTPESAIQNFIDRLNKYPNENIKYYKVIEVELEIPFVIE